VPVATPVTTPVDEPTDATDVLLLLHVPDIAVLVSVAVLPWQSVNVPVITPVPETVYNVAVPGIVL
jgi:hypothetical protein